MLYLFIAGLIVGSFLNVISLRYQPGQKLLDKKIIGGRSRCPSCHRQLVWYELIPIISFLLQLGKCRHCGRRLSLRYPLVEILSGLIFVLVPLALTKTDPFFFYEITKEKDFSGLAVISAVWIFIFVLFLLLSLIDWRHFVIPDSLSLSLAAAGLVLLFINAYYQRFGSLNGSFLRHYAAVFGLRENIWLNYLLAAALGMATLGLIVFLSRGKAMGLGDVKLVGALGLIFGWPDILMIMLLSFIIGALASIISLIFKKKKMKDMIPFGPFLALGSSLTFFFGYQIIDGYFKLFGI